MDLFRTGLAESPVRNTRGGGFSVETCVRSEVLVLELAESSFGGRVMASGLKDSLLRSVSVRSVCGLELAAISFGGLERARAASAHVGHVPPTSIRFKAIQGSGPFNSIIQGIKPGGP